MGAEQSQRAREVPFRTATGVLEIDGLARKFGAQRLQARASQLDARSAT
jgi:hypothetical protein